jgi:hypothetical protein
MTVPYAFANLSGNIALAKLDSNFNTPIIIGNTSVLLGNTITTLNNVTLANVTITSGTSNVTNVSVTTANVVTANIANAFITTANITTANVTTLALTNGLGTASGGTGLTAFIANGVVYASSSSVLATGSVLTFDGTQFGVNGITVGRGAGAVSTNTAVGANALVSNTSGSTNTSIGQGSLSSNTTGAANTGVGQSALNANTTGVNNTAVGNRTLLSNTTGVQNTAVGVNAASALTTGNNNVAIGGVSCFSSATTDVNSTIVGCYSGSNLNGGYQNTYYGYNLSGSSATAQYEIIIGSGITGKGNSTGFFSSNGGGIYQGNNSSTWSTTSDRRLKKNIVDNITGLDQINSIRVRNFEYRLPEEVDAELKPTDAIKKPGTQLGVIAQEIQQVLPDCVKQESTGVLSVDSDNLTWYLINAVKTLSSEVDRLKFQLNKVQP